MEDLCARAQVLIDLAAARYNFSYLRDALPPGVQICCTVKANAYGHGAARLAQLYQALGAHMLAVATAEEALSLRRAEVHLPILVLGATDPRVAPVLAAQGIRVCLYSEAQAAALSEVARRTGVRIGVHVKLDTGMGRLGFLPQETERILAAATRPGLDPEGCFTHFAMADSTAGDAFTHLQYRRFCAALTRLAAKGLCFRIRHAAGSAAAIAHPTTALNTVRLGIALYGISPFSDGRPLALHPILRLTAPILHHYTCRAGQTVGYGGTYRAREGERIAVLPIGYADGLPRRASEYGMAVRLRGQLCPFVGRVCMDMATVSLGAMSCAIGEWVLIYGGSGRTAISWVAKRMGAIPYELTCALGARLPRLFYGVALDKA